MIAYKNLIETLESLSISTVIGHFFFTKGPLNLLDYGEFVKHDSIAKDHLTSAEHFLQKTTFLDSLEFKELDKWFVHIVESTLSSRNIQIELFANRREITLSNSLNISGDVAEEFYLFMHNTVFQKIKDIQEIIREEIRYG
jgi:hypothetical protein